MKVYDIVGKKNLWLLLSFVVVLICIGVMTTRYLSTKQIFNMGIDFTGGSSITLRMETLEQLASIDNKDELKSKKSEFLSQVRKVLKEFGLEKSVVHFTTGKKSNIDDITIKTHTLDNATRENVLSSLESKFGKMELLESDIIGPSIGEELAQQSFKIVLLAVFLLLVYITFRFEFAFGVAAILALVHDALITIGMAGLLHVEINTAFVAAVLTILGYSINDTIVIFDRIRENIPMLKKKQTVESVANLSIRQSVARSINTSLTTLVVLICIFIFGGATIKNFALVLIIGIASGTYSSIFIASPLLVKLKNWQDN